LLAERPQFFSLMPTEGGALHGPSLSSCHRTIHHAFHTDLNCNKEGQSTEEKPTCVPQVSIWQRNKATPWLCGWWWASLQWEKQVVQGSWCDTFPGPLHVPCPIVFWDMGNFFFLILNSTFKFVHTHDQTTWTHKKGFSNF
jgi:hypothetical protein